MIRSPTQRLARGTLLYAAFVPLALLIGNSMGGGWYLVGIYLGLPFSALVWPPGIIVTGYISSPIGQTLVRLTALFVITYTVVFPVGWVLVSMFGARAGAYPRDARRVDQRPDEQSS